MDKKTETVKKDKNKTKKKLNKKHIKWIVLAAIIIVAAAVVLIMKLTDKGYAVTTEKVKTADVKEYYETTAILKSGSDVNYSLAEGITVKKFYISVGDEVKIGDKLADLDTSSLDSQISDKKQSLTDAQNRYNELKSEIDAAESATNGISLPNTVSSNSSSSSEQLLAVYKQLVDNAQEEYDDAVSQKTKYQNGIVAENEGIVTAVNIKEGETFTASASSDDTYSNMLSILSGLSGSDSEDISSAVSAVTDASQSQTSEGTAVTIQSIDGVYGEFSLGKYDSQLVKKGMSAKIEFLDYDYTGSVSYISATAESTDSTLSALTGSSSSSNTLEAHVSIDKADSNLTVGFDASVSILIDEANNAVTIPIEALNIKDGKKYVYVFDSENSVAEKRQVEVGISSDSLYEVKSGLKVGEIVITNPSGVTDGMKVYNG